jgi:phage shock protein PspC (stress-responsive transcriptional regulator)
MCAPPLPLRFGRPRARDPAQKWGHPGDFGLSPGFRAHAAQGKFRVVPGWLRRAEQRRLLGMDVTMNDVDPSRGEGTPPPPPPPAPSAAASPVRRLYRDPHGPIGGVASGMAGYFDIDPVIVRLLWIVALLTGVGFFAYFVCWVVVPKAPAWPPPGYAARSIAETRSATLAGLVIVALAAWIGKGVDGVGDWLMPAVLIGLGVYLLNQRSAERRQSAEPGGVSPGAGAIVPAAAAPVGPAGLVTPTVLSLLALGAGLCWALHAAGLVQPSISGVASGGLVLVGAGLIASLWFGRAPGLIGAGLGLVGVLLSVAAVEPLVDTARAFRDGAGPFDLSQLPGAVGERHYQPATLQDLESSYSHGVGELTLDLTHIDFSEVTRDVQIQLGVGEATVIVPEDVNLEVRGHVGLGEARALDKHDGGMGSHVELNDPRTGSGTLRVNFNIGMGEGKVRRGK